MKNKINVLVIDDNINSIERIKKYFSNHAVINVVDSANDGEEGLTKIKEYQSMIDIIVMDIIIPKLDGIALLEKLKELNIHKKIIVLTSYSQEETIRKISEYKINYYMLKPFDMLSLNNRILDAYNDQEIIYQPEGEKIKLFTPVDEPALHLPQDVLMGLGQYKEKQLELNSKQLKLRDSIQDKKEYVSDGDTTLEDIAYALSDTKRPMNFTVIRNGKEVNLKPIYSDENGTIGIQQKITEVLVPTKTPVQIIKASSEYVWTNTELMILGLVKLFTGQIPMQDLHGIVAITKLGGDVIENQGLFKGLLLTAIISINLAIINLLPIPALDGGHLLFLTIEKIKGKPLDEKTIEKIGNIGFSFLLILMFLIIFNDIFALITKKI